MKSSQKTKQSIQQKNQWAKQDQADRLMWIKQLVQEKYYDNEHVRKAVAEAFLDLPDRRATAEK